MAICIPTPIYEAVHPEKLRQGTGRRMLCGSLTINQLPKHFIQICTFAHPYYCTYITSIYNFFLLYCLTKVIFFFSIDCQLDCINYIFTASVFMPNTVYYVANQQFATLLKNLDILPGWPRIGDSIYIQRWKSSLEELASQEMPPVYYKGCKFKRPHLQISQFVETVGLRDLICKLISRSSSYD